MSLNFILKNFQRRVKFKDKKKLLTLLNEISKSEKPEFIKSFKKNYNYSYKKETLKKFKKFIEDLNQVILDYEIKGIVIGNPINMDGSLGPRSQSAKDFAQNISKVTNLPITLWDERLSSEGAFNLMGDLDINSSKKTEKLDQHAAAFILQGYLDFLNK